MMNRIRRLLLLGLVVSLGAGCITGPNQNGSLRDLEREIASIPRQSTTPDEEGALWSSRTSVSLYADHKARMVGDIVTISIVESAKATKNATTNTERTSGLAASWSGVFDSFASGFTVNGTPIGTSHKVALANNFDGEGETTRTSSMLAYITARVIQVLSNGQLMIRGSRQVQVNNENQFIFIQGVIRPEDISSTNVILSTYISDASIQLTGSGSVSDKQKPGWLASIVDWAWPF